MPEEPVAPPFVPSPKVIETAGGALQDLQEIVAAMGKGPGKDTPEYQQVMTLFKELGADLHAARQLAAASKVVAPKAVAELPDKEPLPLPPFRETFGPAGKTGVVSMGEEVGHLQQVLAHLGYDVEDSEEYDKQTLKAVQQFQETYGLEATGIVNAEMRNLLNRYVSG